MLRSIPVLLALATLSAGASAQYNANPAVPGPYSNDQSSYGQQQSAPVARINNVQPIPGVFVRSDVANAVTTVSADANGTEVRISQGRANIQVNHPAHNSEILVDLPGGQASLIKDGFYTLNANTNTLTVLQGEAETFPSNDPNAKPIKVKEDHESILSATGPSKPASVDQRQLTADLLPGGPRNSDGDRGYGYGPYGDGFYGYPPYPYYGFGYGYPYGWGYPYGFGLGFGYYGGFGGFRGGYGGFRGGYHR